MNTQLIKRLTDFLLMALIFLNVMSCTKRERVLIVSEIWMAIKIEDTGYNYSEESLMEIQDSKYSLRRKAIYDEKGDLWQFMLYKSEGKLEYSKEAVWQDKNIIRHVGIPLHQKWTYNGGKLRKNDQTVSVKEINDSLVKTEMGAKVIFYRLRKQVREKKK